MSASPTAAADLLAHLARLPAGAWLELPRLGWFGVDQVPAYEGTNPRTGERVHTPAKATLTFFAHPSLEAAVVGEDAAADEPDASASIEVLAGGEALGRALCEALLAHGRAALPGFGAWRVQRPVDAAADDDLDHDLDDEPMPVLGSRGRVRLYLEPQVREQLGS